MRTLTLTRLRSDRRWRTVIIVLAVLIAIRVALPHLIRWYVNEELNRKVDAYEFHIGDVDLWLIRGAVEVEDVIVTKVGGAAPVPFVNTDELDISIYWKRLFDGAFVLEIIAEHPVINLVLSKKKEWVQTGVEVSWLKLIKELAPIRIDEFVVNDGEINMYNYDLVIQGNESEPARVFANGAQAVIRNLTNSEDLSGTLVASINARAKVMGETEAVTTMRLDPFDKIPTFDLDLEMHDLPVARLDRMMKTYAALDLERGTFSMAMEAASNRGQLTGYVKPVFRDLEVFRIKEDIEEDKDTGLEAVWESVAGTVGALFQNQPKQQVATKIEFGGTISAPEPDILGTIAGIFRNAFIKAFMPELEHSVRLRK